MRVATGSSTTTIGTPMTIQSRKRTVTSPYSWMKKMPRMLMELPAGVATPPMRAAKGTPIITTFANDDRPGVSPILSKRPTARAMKMAVAGTSDMMVDTRHVPTMNTHTTRRLSVPAFESSHSEKRRSSPELMNAWATTNIARTKKKTG